MPRWTQDEIAMEILGLFAAGEALNYGEMERRHPSLLRVACRHFGSWQQAVEFAGLSYEEIRKYRRWTRARIVARIQELHRQGVDLSWRSVSTRVDPQLAAAAVRPDRFGSWRAAVKAAGLNYEEVRRYRKWDEERVVAAVRELADAGHALNSGGVQAADLGLFAAARRRFEGWDAALEAAGLSADSIRRRAPARRRRSR